MRSIHIEIIRLAIIAVTVFVLHLLIFAVFQIPETLPYRVIIFALAFCAADYAEYFLAKKHIITDSGNPYLSFANSIQQSSLVQKLHRQKPIHILMILIGVYLVLNVTFTILYSLITGEEDFTDISSGKSLTYFFIGIVIIVPLLETLLCQLIPIEIIKRITPKVNGRSNYFFAVLVSAILFSIGHNYSVDYVISMFFMGLCLAAVYALVSTKDGRTMKDGYIWTTILHMANNSVGFLITVCEGIS